MSCNYFIWKYLLKSVICCKIIQIGNCIIRISCGLKNSLLICGICKCKSYYSKIILLITQKLKEKKTWDLFHQYEGWYSHTKSLDGKFFPLCSARGRLGRYNLRSNFCITFGRKKLLWPNWSRYPWGLQVGMTLNYMAHYPKRDLISKLF